MAWSEKYISSLKPAERDRDVYETRGFGIRIRKSGKLIWILNYSFQGKQKIVKLGVYRNKKDNDQKDNDHVIVSLKDARKRAYIARSLIVKGEDPANNKHLFDPTAPPPKSSSNLYTVDDLVKDYLADWASAKVKRSYREDKRLLDKYIISVWGVRDVAGIKRTEAAALVQNVANVSAGEARNITRVASTVWSYAIFVKEVCEANPFTRMSWKVPKARVSSRDRCLNDDELKLVWQKLSNSATYTLVRRAIRLVFLLALRPGEVVQFRYDWIDKSGEWLTIPKSCGKVGRNKNIKDEFKYDHRVYLPPLARELIGKGEGFVFPGGDNGHLKENTLSQYIRKTLKRGNKVTKEPYFGISKWRPNDLRRTAATKLAQIGAIQEEINAIQWHLIPGIAGIYIKYKYDEQKKKWLTELDKCLTELIGESEDIVEEVRVLNNDEIRKVWNALENHVSVNTAKCICFILITGQPPGICASCNNEDIMSDIHGDWWTPSGTNINVFLPWLALLVLRSNKGYAFLGQKGHVEVGTLSHLILKSNFFGIDKFTPNDLRNTAIARIRALGAPQITVDAIRSGNMANKCEIKHWFDKWASELEKIIES